MAVFKISISAAGEEAHSQQVEADDWSEAIFEVLEDFKHNAKVANSKTWDVKVQEVNE